MDLDFKDHKTNQTKKDKEIDAMKADNAFMAFDLMLAQGEAATARQEVADLNFQLMINGVI